MKGNSKIIILVVIFAVLLIAILGLQKKQKAEQAEIRQEQNTPFFPGLTSDQVYRLEINSLQGESLLLRKEAGQWEIARGKDIFGEMMANQGSEDGEEGETQETYNPLTDTGPAGDSYRTFYIAKPDMVSSMIDEIIGLRHGNVVTSDPGKHTQFKVLNNIVGTEVILHDQSMNVLASLIIGDMDYASQTTYVRSPDEDEVYRVSSSLSMQLRSTLVQLRDTHIFNVPPESISAYNLTDHETGMTLRLAKEEGIWHGYDTNNVEIPLDIEKVDNILETVGSLAANSFIDPNDPSQRPVIDESESTTGDPWGLLQPTAVVTFTTADNQSYTLNIGSETGTTYFVNTDRDLNDICRVSSANIDKLRPAPEFLAPGENSGDTTAIDAGETTESEGAAQEEIPPEILDQLREQLGQ